MVTVKTVEPSGWYTRQIFTCSYQPDRLTDTGECFDLETQWKWNRMFH